MKVRSSPSMARGAALDGRAVQPPLPASRRLLGPLERAAWYRWSSEAPPPSAVSRCTIASVCTSRSCCSDHVGEPSARERLDPVSTGAHRPRRHDVAAGFVYACAPRRAPRPPRGLGWSGRTRITGQASGSKDDLTSARSAPRRAVVAKPGGRAAVSLPSRLPLSAAGHPATRSRSGRCDWPRARTSVAGRAHRLPRMCRQLLRRALPRGERVRRNRAEGHGWLRRAAWADPKCGPPQPREGRGLRVGFGSIPPSRREVGPLLFPHSACLTSARGSPVHRRRVVRIEAARGGHLARR